MKSAPATAGPSLRRWMLPALLSLALMSSGAACEEEPAPFPSPRPWPTGTALTWQVQLTGDLELNVDADVFEFDAFTTPVQAVERLRARGRRLICYLNAGVHEASRPDADRFPPEVIGASAGSSEERWLDIREWGTLKPILLDRLRLCRGKGFHAVDLDNVDGYAHLSGFPLTFDDQLRFNRRLAELVRSLDLSPGLRNNLDQVTALEPDFDFAINEECFVLGECDRLSPFIEAGKPVFHVEYELPTAEFCPSALGYGFASIRKDPDLGIWRIACLP
ncbi:MAG TPA: endo alpha-1,4 polygalactosaminidase [Micromonosporaceae bacterium]|nr:endo alpha-1,4 polygalactosaminidase [Micromonosporaceae bacterium]